MKTIYYFRTNSEAATRRVLWEKVFLEISQNSQESTSARVSLIPLNFAKFLRTSFLQNTSGRLLLKILHHRCGDIDLRDVFSNMSNKYMAVVFLFWSNSFSVQANIYSCFFVLIQNSFSVNLLNIPDLYLFFKWLLNSLELLFSIRHSNLSYVFSLREDI